MNPFAPYLSCYPPGSVPERPWWRLVHSELTRSDGVYLARRAMGAIFGLRADYPGFIREGEDYDVAMARIDAEHPIPAPPPLVGQVWAHRKPNRPWTYSSVAEVEPVGWMAESLEPTIVQVAAGALSDCYAAHPEAICEDGPLPWPPPNAVLVYGPHAPWASPGWKP